MSTRTHPSGFSLSVRRYLSQAGNESSRGSRPAWYVSLVSSVRLGRSTFRPQTAAVATTAVANARETRATKVDRGRIRERTQHTDSVCSRSHERRIVWAKSVCLIIPFLKLNRKSIGIDSLGILACRWTRGLAIYELSHGKVNVSSSNAFPRIIVYTYVHHIRCATALLIFTWAEKRVIAHVLICAMSASSCPSSVINFR